MTWNLTDANIGDAPGASFGSVAPGVKTSSLTIYTTNAVPKYSNSLPISLQGNEVSKAAFLVVGPAEVDLGGLVVGGPGADSGLDSSIIISNIGRKDLTITGYAYTDDTDLPIEYTNVTFGAVSKIGDVFTSTDLPAVGSIIRAGTSITVPVQFKTDKTGNYQDILQIWSDGGSKNVLFTASATTSPIAELSLETSEHGFVVSDTLDFGNIIAGTVQTRRLRICNKGGSALLITKSKPPIQTELQAENPTSDLHEGQVIPVNDCAFGPVDIAATPETPNVPDHTVSDTWTLNTDDLKFGVHVVQISANIVSRKVGIIKPDGTPLFRYLGCYYDGGGRQLQKLYNLGADNDNDACQKYCYGLNYKFAGTEYHTQCWCGNNPPSSLKYTPESAKKCTFGCAKDKSQPCGGDGTYESIYYNSDLYTPDCNAVPCSSSSLVTSSTASSTISLSSSSSKPVTSSITSVTGTLSTSSVRSSSTTSSSISLSKTSKSTSTSSSAQPASSATVVAQATLGFRYSGCYIEPANGKAMTKLAANDSMSVEFCIAEARARLSAKPATTYRYIGVEYGRECYGATAPVVSQTSLIGNKACTVACKGNTTESCGGSTQYNFYISTAVSGSISSSIATSTTGTIVSTTAR